MLFYLSICSLVALICVQHVSSGTAGHRSGRSTEVKCEDLIAPGWTVKKLANVTLDLWPWNCLDSVYSNISLLEVISNACSDIHDAARKGYIGFLQYYAEKRKIPFNERKQDEGGETPLHLAVQNGHLNIVKCLASKLDFRDLGTTNNYLRTPVMYAAAFGRLDVLKYLLNETEADLNSHDDDKKLALRLAARGGYLLELQYLIEERHYPVTSEDRTLLYAAATGGKVDLIKYLLNEKKIETTFRNGSHNWALHYAAKHGSLAAMKFFIDDLGYDVNLQDDDGETPVHAAAHRGSVPAIRYLIEEERADINLRSNYGASPLHVASSHGHLPVVKYLVDKQHISVEVKDNLWRTPVHQAVQENRMDVVKFLLDERKADKTVKTEDHKTLLHQAVFSRNVGMMRYLIDDKRMQAQIDERDDIQCTAASYAVSWGQLDILKFLIDEEHANATIVDWQGRNILQAAAKMCEFKIVRYLVEEKGFDVNSKSPSGMNAYDYASGCQYDKRGEMLEYLKKKMNEHQLKNSLS